MGKEEEEAHIEGKVTNVDLVTLIQMGINHLCKNNLKKGELVVLSTFINNQFIIWVYPYDANLKVAEALLSTGVLQVKNMSVAQEKAKEENKVKELTNKYVA